MTTYRISPEQEHQLDIDRRNGLARYLINQPSGKQRTFLKGIKSDSYRNDIKDRMRDELAKNIAAMDTNVRNLRLYELSQHRKQSFFKDILSRVNALIEQEVPHEST